MFLGAKHDSAPCKPKQHGIEYRLVVEQIIGGCLGVERIELALYLVGLFKALRVFLLAGKKVAFKFEPVYASAHGLAYLPDAIRLAVNVYIVGEFAVYEIRRFRHAIQFFGSQFLLFVVCFVCHKKKGFE